MTTVPLMSRSALEAAQCGWRYRAIYVQGMKDDSSFSIRGTTLHAVHKHYVRRLALTGMQADHEEAQAAFQAGVAEVGTPPDLIPECFEIWTRYAQKFQLDLAAYHSAEVRVKRSDADVPYTFIPDMVYAHAQADVLEVVDLKSYYVACSDAQARELFQTRMYVWCAMQEFPGFRTYRMTYSFMRLNKFASADFAVESFGELDEQIRAAEASRRRRHETDDWTALPGEQCAFCHLRCPVMDDPDRSHVRVLTPESFEDVAGSKIVLEKKLRAMTKAVKGFSTVKGPVTVNGETFGFFVTQSVSYDAGKVADAIREMGEEPSFRVSANSLKADLKRLPALAAELVDCLPITKEKPRYAHRSLKSTLKTARPLEDGEDETGEGDGE